MKLTVFLLSAIWCAAVQGQEFVVYELVQCYPGGCCPPQYQQPRQQQCPPVGSPGTPRFTPLPQTPAPTPPQAQPDPTPDVDWDALDKKRELEISNLRIEISNINKQVNQIGECNCGEKWAALEARLKIIEANTKEPPKVQPPAPGSVAPAEPQIFYYDIVPRKK